MGPLAALPGSGAANNLPAEGAGEGLPTNVPFQWAYNRTLNESTYAIQPPGCLLWYLVLEALMAQVH